MNTLEILKEARRLVARRYGWTQGSYEDFVTRSPKTGKLLAKPVQCFCAVGAVDHVAKRDDATEAFEVLAKAIGWGTCSYGTAGKVIDWNDLEGRTQGDVVTAFDKAIAAVSA